MFRKQDWLDAIRDWPTSKIVDWTFGGIFGLISAFFAKQIGIPSLDQLEWPTLTGLGYLVIFFIASFLVKLLIGLWPRDTAAQHASAMEGNKMGDRIANVGGHNFGMINQGDIYNGERYYNPAREAALRATKYDKNVPVKVLPTLGDAGTMAFCNDMRTAFANLGFNVLRGPLAENVAMGFPYFRGIDDRPGDAETVVFVGDVRIPN
jgi:hypothetical protein